MCLNRVLVPRTTHPLCFALLLIVSLLVLATSITPAGHTASHQYSFDESRSEKTLGPEDKLNSETDSVANELDPGLVSTERNQRESGINYRDWSRRSEARTPTTVASSQPCDISGSACIYSDDNDPVGSRTPLVFIHGVHGNKITIDSGSCYRPEFNDGIDDPVSHPNTCYFSSLIGDLGAKYPDLTSKYKIYRFYYKSDVYYVQKIASALGQRLDDLINADPNFDKEFLIVAHSMGGLVARAYMSQYIH